MKKRKPSSKFTLGKKLKNKDLITVTDRGRFLGDIGNDTHRLGMIITTIKELEALVKQAKKTNKNLNTQSIFFVHLSPDVSFGIVRDKDKWLGEK